MRWQRMVLSVAMVAIVMAGTAGWVAVGLLADSVDQGLARAGQSLDAAIVLAEETADTLDDIANSLTVVGDGLLSTADALASTRDLSATVRDTLGAIRFLDSVQELRERLLAVEDSLIAVEVDLGRAQRSLGTTAEQLRVAADAVRDIPLELQAGQADLASARDQIDTQVWWWRVAIIAGTVAFLAVTLVLSRNLNALAVEVPAAT